MADTHQIRCIHTTQRTDPHQRIASVGGVNSDGTRWRLSQQVAIDGITSGMWAFFVEINRDRVQVIVAVSRCGHKYLKTKIDGDQPDNLLSLPECP
jgi:hypothetical protein